MKRIVVALALIAGVLAGACNGDDGDGTPTSSPAATAPAARATPRPTATAAAPTASATSAPTPFAGAIAYILPEEGDIWLVSADRALKSISGVGANRALGRSNRPFWQRNYREHVIREEEELHAIRQYIRANPGNWPDDPENPSNM